MYQYEKLFLFFDQLLSVEALMALGNSVKKIREAQLLSKAELARKAGVSPLTIDRIEKGKACRMETKRKIIIALGYKLSDKDKIFMDAK
jgi:DNA-binding XRE family transcriptional regulator